MTYYHVGTDLMNSILLMQEPGCQPEDRSYTPSGDVLAGKDVINISLGFNGERRDPVSGTTHLGNGYRAYNPILMRFNCPDNLSPFGAGGINPYVYCEGDPINRSDPSGHLSILQIVGLVGGILGLLLALLSGGMSIAAMVAARTVARTAVEIALGEIAEEAATSIVPAAGEAAGAATVDGTAAAAIDGTAAAAVEGTAAGEIVTTGGLDTVSTARSASSMASSIKSQASAIAKIVSPLADIISCSTTIASIAEEGEGNSRAAAILGQISLGFFALGVATGVVHLGKEVKEIFKKGEPFSALQVLPLAEAMHTLYDEGMQSNDMALRAKERKEGEEEGEEKAEGKAAVSSSKVSTVGNSTWAQPNHALTNMLMQSYLPENMYQQNRIYMDGISLHDRLRTAMRLQAFFLSKNLMKGIS